MDAWMEYSPFSAVGIYISGASRACRSQPNLTTTWISTQLAKGWRLLPITLGPQSSCVGRFPRYGASIDPTIRESSTNSYAAARKQGTAEAKSAVAVAKGLGITAGSTLWYDLEGWSNVNDVSCRESALSFLQAWTKGLHDLGYVSGVYSSAGSGMVILDNARKNRPDYVLPDRIWIARWDGVANTSTSYISDDGWRPGGRMKQYKGGHNETWGGVTINIDSNYLDLGKGSVRLAAAEVLRNTVSVDFPAYHRMKAGTAALRRGQGAAVPAQASAASTRARSTAPSVPGDRRGPGVPDGQAHRGLQRLARPTNWTQLLSSRQVPPREVRQHRPVRRPSPAGAGVRDGHPAGRRRRVLPLHREPRQEVAGPGRPPQTGVMSSKAWAMLKAGDLLLTRTTPSAARPGPSGRAAVRFRCRDSGVGHSATDVRRTG